MITRLHSRDILKTQNKSITDVVNTYLTSVTISLHCRVVLKDTIYPNNKV